MPRRPMHHPLDDVDGGRAMLERTIPPRALDSTGQGTPTPAAPARRHPVPLPPAGRPARASTHEPRPEPARSVSTRGMDDAAPAAHEDGSIATEYGLLAVVAATIVSVMLEWATSGGITALLASIMARVASLVGL